MKAFLENFAAILGAVTVVILGMSVSHEYGYFWSIGRQFQTFLTTTDYFANGVLWLPLAILFMYSTNPFYLMEDEPAPQKQDWRDWKTWLVNALVAALVSYILLTTAWPLGYMTGIWVVIIAVTFWSMIWRRFFPKTDLENPFHIIIRQLIRIGPPVLFGMFVYGSVNANYDLTRTDEPYGFQFKNDDTPKLRIFLRNFEKGALIRNPTENKIEFYKWDEIVKVNRPVTSSSGPLVCYFFGWWCDPPRPPQFN